METIKPECNGTVAGDTQPNTYLNYILFDKNYKVMDMGWTAVPSSANFAQQKISIPTVTAKEAGYIFVYLSYEDQSNNWVYFDDFKVTFTPTSILQSNEYYPFGLQTANSWTRDNTVTNNFLANGGTELNTVSALYDLQYRNYDAALGRFHQVDPLSDRYGSHTPYNYAFGNPVSMNDPNGAGPGDSGTDNVCSLMQAMGMMHYSPYENHHYDADHEDPGIGYYLN